MCTSTTDLCLLGSADVRLGRACYTMYVHLLEQVVGDRSTTTLEFTATYAVRPMYLKLSCKCYTPLLRGFGSPGATGAESPMGRCPWAHCNRQLLKELIEKGMRKFGAPQGLRPNHKSRTNLSDSGEKCAESGLSVLAGGSNIGVLTSSTCLFFSRYFPFSKLRL